MDVKERDGNKIYLWLKDNYINTVKGFSNIFMRQFASGGEVVEQLSNY